VARPTGPGGTWRAISRPPWPSSPPSSASSPASCGDRIQARSVTALFGRKYAVRQTAHSVSLALSVLWPLGAVDGGGVYWAHIGGFVAGLARVFLFRTPKLPPPLPPPPSATHRVPEYS